MGSVQDLLGALGPSSANAAALPPSALMGGNPQMPQPQSFSDYARIGNLPLSPNIEDRRNQLTFMQRYAPWAFASYPEPNYSPDPGSGMWDWYWNRGQYEPPPTTPQDIPQQRLPPGTPFPVGPPGPGPYAPGPFPTARPLMTNASVLPAGPGPAPTGTPYPQAPQPEAGSSILWQKIDPTTTMLSNIPSTTTTTQPPSMLDILRQSGILPSGEPPGKAYAGDVAQGDNYPKATGNLREDYHSLYKLLRSDEHDARRVGMEPGSVASPESLSLLQSLIDNGSINVTENDFDTGIPFPGGDLGRQRMVRLVDFWRDMQNASVPGGGPYGPSNLPPGYQTGNLYPTTQWEIRQGPQLK